MGKKLISIRLSDIPPNIFMKVVIVNPLDFHMVLIPNKSAYVRFNAYWFFEEDKRPFILTLPYRKLITTLKTIPKKNKLVLTKPIIMTFCRDKHYNIIIKEIYN